jgi:hypothetical protein
VRGHSVVRGDTSAAFSMTYLCNFSCGHEFLKLL